MKNHSTLSTVYSLVIDSSEEIYFRRGEDSLRCENITLYSRVNQIAFISSPEVRNAPRVHLACWRALHEATSEHEEPRELSEYIGDSSGMSGVPGPEHVTAQ